MKKLLVFREGMCPDSREVDDYLHDSEVIRGDFIDLNPDDERKYTKGRMALYDSTWSVVFKDDHLYDHWHLVGEVTRPYAFDEDTFKATNTLLEPYREHLLLTAVLTRCCCRRTLRSVTSALTPWKTLHKCKKTATAI